MPTITVDIKAVGGAQFQRSFEQASQVMGRTFPQAARVAEAQVSSMTKALELQSQVLARVKSQAVGAFAAYLGAGALVQATRSIVQSTNALIGWQNALKAVSPDAKAAAAGMTFVRNEADRLGLSLESMAGQFARFSAATRGTALEGEQTRAIFTAMSEASRVLNLSVDGTEGAFRALEQMVSKGKVQAEELRGQLGERLPGAFRLAAEALGVTTEELNKMLELGQVTAENLLPKLAERLRDVYSAAAVNAANSPAAEFNRLSNALFDLRVAVGDSGVMEGLTRGAREATDALRGVVDSGAIDRIASGLGTVATAVGLAFGGRSIAAVANYASSIRESVAETVASVKATESAAIAKNRLAAAEAAAAGNAYLYAEQQMRSAIGTKSADMAAKQLAAARMAQVRANAALVLSEKELTAAQMQSAASANAASMAASKMAAVGKSVFAMVGGWPTVFLAAGYAAYQMWDSMANGSDEANAALRGLNNIIESNERQLQRLRNAANGVDEGISDQITAFRDAGDRIYEYEQRIKMLQIASEDQNRATIAGAGAWSVYQIQLKTAETDLANATAAMDAAMTSSFELAAAQDRNAAANKQSSANLRTLVDGYLRSGATFDEITAKLEAMGLMQDYVNQLFREAPRAAEQAAAGFDKETQDFIDKMKEQAEEIGKTRAQLVLLRAERQAESASNQAAKDAIMEQANALARLIEAEDSRRLSLRQANADMKDAEKAAKDLERSQARWADMIGRVASGLSDAQKVEEKYQNTMRDSEALAEKLIASGAKRAEIEEQLKLIQSDAAQVREQEIAVVNEQAEAAERYIQALMSETTMIGMSYEAAAKLQARLQAEEKMRDEIAKAMKAGKAYTQEQIQAKIEEAGAIAEANVALEQYINYLSDIKGMSGTDISVFTSGLSGENIADPLWEAVEASDELRDALAGAFELTPAQRLRKEIEALTEALNIQGITAEEVGAIQSQIEGKRQALLENNLGLIAAGIGSLQSMAKEGSKSAQILEVAQNAVNLALAIGAVVNQGKGDPYTAFARMAAMAAAVVPLVGSIGGMFGGGGGPAENSAAYRQERQGTGTVLGDSTAKSESILNAVEITADATSELVGINRGMLNALNAMVAGISGASALLARGAGDIDIGPLNTGSRGILFNLGNIFGGKESLRDQGIRIVGGTLNSMINDIMVQSYASIHRSGGWFSSSRDYDSFTTLGDDVSRQFSMVLSSMADAVRAAAEALGLNMDEINARIASFRIEEIRISTMDLSAEEAQKELEAAFSAIFDGLAGHVVPFIDQFQKVGEGLAETLIRVATSVQVAQEAVIQLGFALDETDPEKFAQISVRLMDLMGGIEGFIEGMSAFVDAFATDEHKFAVAQDALTRAFAQFGVAIPESRDAMWDLMQSLDATSEAGREQIAMLLQLAGVADSYYRQLEEQESRLRAIDAALADTAWGQYLDGLTSSERAFAELTRQFDDLRESFIASGATAAQLTTLEDQRAEALNRLTQQLQAQRESILGSISNDIADLTRTDFEREVARIRAQAEAYMQALEDIGMSMSAATQAVTPWIVAMLNAAEAARDATAAAEAAQRAANIANIISNINTAIAELDMSPLEIEMARITTQAAQYQAQLIENGMAQADATAHAERYRLALIGSAQAQQAATAAAEAAQRAANVANIIDQINAAIADLDMTPLQRQLLGITTQANAYRDQLVANGMSLAEATAHAERYAAALRANAHATEAATQAAEAARLQAEAAQRAATVTNILDGNDWHLFAGGLSASERAIAEINRQFGEYRQTLIDNGATTEQLSTLEAQRTETLRRLAAQQALTEQEERDRIRRTVTDFMQDLRQTNILAEIDDPFTASLAQLGFEFSDHINRAREMGASELELAEIRELHQAASRRLYAAEAERLAQAESAYQDIVRGLQDEIDAAGMSDFTAAMREISRWTAKTTDELNAAARAAGRQSAAEGDLARMHQVAALRAAQALARLQEQAQALAEELYGTPLSRLEDQIAALQETESAAVSAIGGLSDALGDAARNAAEAMGLLLGSYSPLRASDKLPIALDALRRGETDANTVLSIARDVYASGRAYNQIFDQVQAIVRAQTSAETGGASSAYTGGTAVSAEMQALIAERDALLAEQQAAQRFMQASNLAQMVADLSGARGEGFDTIAESLGFTLEQFAEDLRFEGLGDLTEYLTALQADQLGFAELFDTPTAGDLEIVDAITALSDAIHVPEADDTAAQERAETLTTLRDVRDALRVIAERGVNANEDAATATERVAEGVERLADILESDGAAVAAATGRGG